jgi:hypothetical protein
LLIVCPSDWKSSLRRFVMKYLAVAALFLTVATLPIVGGVLFALFLFGPLFLLALIGVLAGLENRTVRQHNPGMDPRRWRDGS